MNHTVELFPSVPVTPTTRKDRDGWSKNSAAMGESSPRGLSTRTYVTPFCRSFERKPVHHGDGSARDGILDEPVTVGVHAVHGHKEKTRLDIP